MHHCTECQQSFNESPFPWLQRGYVVATANLHERPAPFDFSQV
jgi:hypothetical protein